MQSSLVNEILFEIRDTNSFFVGMDDLPPIRILYSDPTVLDYCKKVYFNRITLESGPEWLTTLYVSRPTNVTKYLLSKNEPSDLVKSFGTYNLFVHKKFVSLKILSENLIVNYSDNPRHGVSSMTRKIALLSYKNKYSALLPFHASGITDLNGNITLFATKGGIGGNNKGKTTTLLNILLQSNGKYQYVTNDDFLVYRNMCEYNYIDLPAEITIRSGTVKTINKLYNLSLKIEQKKDYAEITQEELSKMFILKKRQNPYRIKSIVQVDLNKNNERNVISKLEYGEMLKRFIYEWLHNDRISHLNSDLLHGEIIGQNSTAKYIKSLHDETNKYYEYLVQNKTDFYKLQGNFDARDLYDTLDRELL